MTSPQGIVRVTLAILSLALLGACQSAMVPYVILRDEIQIRVPSAGWQLSPHAAYRAESEVLVVYKLTPPEGMAAQVVSQVSASANIQAPSLPVKQFVLGKSWTWNSDATVTFIESLKEIEDDVLSRLEVVSSASN